METKRFIGSDLARLFERVKRDLGPDAVIVRTRSLLREGAEPLVELVVAPPDAEAELSLDLQRMLVDEALGRVSTPRPVTIGDLEDQVAREVMAEVAAMAPMSQAMFETPTPPDWLQGFVTDAPSGPFPPLERLPDEPARQFSPLERVSGDLGQAEEAPVARRPRRLSLAPQPEAAPDAALTAALEAARTEAMEAAREAAAEAAREEAAEAAREAAAEAAREAAAEAAREEAAEAAREAAAEAAREAAAEAAREAAAEAAREAAAESAREAALVAAREAAAAAALDYAPDEALAHGLDYAPEGDPETARRGAPVYALDRASDDIPEAAPDDALEAGPAAERLTLLRPETSARKRGWPAARVLPAPGEDGPSAGDTPLQFQPAKPDLAAELAAAGLSEAAARVVSRSPYAALEPQVAVANVVADRLSRYPDEGQTALITIEGPAGSGRTTALMRLALDCADAGRDTLLVAADSGHVGAREQVHAYGSAIGLEVMDAFEPGELVRIVARATPGTCVFLDVPAGEWTAPLWAAGQHYRYLALPANWQQGAYERMIGTARAGDAAGWVVTFADITTNLTPVLSLVLESPLGIAFLSSGRDVSSGIGVVDALTLASGIFTIRRGDTTNGRFAASA